MITTLPRLLLALVVLSVFQMVAKAENPLPQPERTEVTISLRRGDFTLLRYQPGQAPYAAFPKAIIIFGSGDGGFDGWEHKVCQALQAAGYEMIGFDCALYAKSDYDLPTLQGDMAKIAASVEVPYGPRPPPLVLGGWSMGAVQGVAAAGGPVRIPGLAGLLLISPGDRGRYGLRVADRFDVTPTGTGTFALTDFDKNLDAYRIVQWNGNLDLMGSKTWLNSLSATHKAYDYPWGMHDYGGASEKFLKQLKESIEWMLMPTGPNERTD
jgi:alpha-beta hydrolase superfamily lysophospholipase